MARYEIHCLEMRRHQVNLSRGAIHWVRLETGAKTKGNLDLTKLKICRFEDIVELKLNPWLRVSVDISKPSRVSLKVHFCSNLDGFDILTEALHLWFNSLDKGYLGFMKTQPQAPCTQ
jgi:hypothetical protein